MLWWWAYSSLMSAPLPAEPGCEVASGCSTVGLYCVTITWQQIFKGSVQVAVVGVLPYSTSEPAAERRRFGRYFSKAATSDSSKPRSFMVCKKKHERICSNAFTTLKNPMLVWDRPLVRFLCDEHSPWKRQAKFYWKSVGRHVKFYWKSNWSL